MVFEPKMVILGPKLTFWVILDKYWPFEPGWKYPYRKLYLWCCLFLLRLLGHLHNGGGYLPAGHYYCILYSIKTRHNFWGPGRFLNDVECQSYSTLRVTCRIESNDLSTLYTWFSRKLLDRLESCPDGLEILTKGSKWCGKFPNVLESFKMLWEVLGWFRKFTLVKKVFRQSWYFLDGLKVFGLLCAFAHVELFTYSTWICDISTNMLKPVYVICTESFCA